MKSLSECYHPVKDIDFQGRHQEEDGTVVELYWCPKCNSILKHIAYSMKDTKWPLNLYT